MSTWYDIKNQEDVDLSDDGKELHIWFDSDDWGSKYVTVPIEFILEALKGL